MRFWKGPFKLLSVSQLSPVDLDYMYMYMYMYGTVYK